MWFFQNKMPGMQLTFIANVPFGVSAERKHYIGDFALKRC